MAPRRWEKLPDNGQALSKRPSQRQTISASVVRHLLHRLQHEFIIHFGAYLIIIILIISNNYNIKYINLDCTISF